MCSGVHYLTNGSLLTFFEIAEQNTSKNGSVPLVMVLLS